MVWMCCIHIAHTGGALSRPLPCQYNYHRFHIAFKIHLDSLIMLLVLRLELTPLQSFKLVYWHFIKELLNDKRH